MESIKIFIFEDEWMCREAIASVIGKTDDIEVIGEAEAADAGLEKVLSLKPDVVLMDIRLKGGDCGLEATAEITEKLPQTKVIICTHLPDEANLHAAVKAGAVGYLLKKEMNDPDTIIRAIRSVYHEGSFMKPATAAKVLKILRNYKKHGNHGLTRRELEVFQLMGEGKDNKHIARALEISENTVANHVSNILSKMGVDNRTGAVVIARREGII